MLRKNCLFVECEILEDYREENEKLKQELSRLHDMIDRHCLIVETLEDYAEVGFLIDENEKLKKEVEKLKEYKSMYEGLCK